MTTFVMTHWAPGGINKIHIGDVAECDSDDCVAVRNNEDHIERGTE